MNERIARLRAKNLTQQPEICSERAQIVTRAYEKYKDLPPLLLRAKTFEAIMQEMTIWIADDELIVGNQAKMAKGAPVYPEFSVDWIIKELDSFSTRNSSRFLLSEENKAVLRGLLPKWQGRTTKDRALSIVPEAAKEAMASQAFLLSPLSSGLGHISVSYQKLIDHGIDFLLDEIREKLAHCQPTAAEVARAGIGMPAYFNDEAIIPVLRNIGCSLAEARDYCEVGCVEPHVAGRMEGMYSAGFTNLCKVLETTIFNGVDPIRGKQIGLAVGEQFEDFTAFYDAYRTQQRYFMDLHAQSVNAVEFAHSTLCPTPLVSCFVDDCIERGVDIRRGGAHYNYTSPNAVGLANLGDSMLVIKRKIFEEKKYSMDELRGFLCSDFLGHERVRQEFLNDVPKYGNDDDEADAMAHRCGEDYCTDFKRYTGHRGASFQPGLQSISAHALFVGSLGATPDGRTKQMLVSDGGVSPAQGRDICGPTAAMLSVAKLNHLEATNGALLNVKFHPSAVKGERGLENLCALTDAFFGLGAQHVQYNVVDSEVLRDAQKHPEKYGDLVVRVAGFSVLFTTLDTVLQNDIIERTQHNCC